jgi:hypothetical protein
MIEIYLWILLITAGIGTLIFSIQFMYLLSKNKNYRGGNKKKMIQL